MDTIRKINRTRKHLKRYLAKEWDVSEIQELSEKEIEILYTSKVPHKSDFASLGCATGCNFSLQHRVIPSHYLHVIYFHFPELGETPLKLTKTCAEKLKKLYSSGGLDPEDSLLMIIANPISETVGTAIEEVYVYLQQEIQQKGLGDAIAQELKDVNDLYQVKHLGNIHLFYLDHLAIDITDHVLVPSHECFRDEPTIQEILTQCNATREQFPLIQRTDPQAKVMRMAPGDICKIKRRTLAGEITTYRICA
jgi:DNA-directed RNA polymerase subunit H (RpoH/RPB5)